MSTVQHRIKTDKKIQLSIKIVDDELNDLGLEKEWKQPGWWWSMNGVGCSDILPQATWFSGRGRVDVLLF